MIRQFIFKVYNKILVHIGHKMHERIYTRINRKGLIPETVYIIRRFPGGGFFSDYFYVISHIIYAHRGGV